MELQIISTAVRYSAEVNGFRIEASMKNEKSLTKLEGGNIYDAESGEWLGGFSVNSGGASYNFNTSDREKRSAMMQAIGEFESELMKQTEEENA